MVRVDAGGEHARGWYGRPATGLLKVDLNGAWQVTMEGATEVLSATVPGCIHTDLLAAKKIPGPFWRDNEVKVQWVSDKAWIYRRTFEVAAADFARQQQYCCAARGSIRWQPSSSTASKSAIPTTCSAPGNSTSRSCSRPAATPSRSSSIRSSPISALKTKPIRCRPGNIPRPTIFARSPATSAGTGAPRSSPAVSGRTSAWWPSTPRARACWFCKIITSPRPWA